MPIWYLENMNLGAINQVPPFVIFSAILWSLLWKGLALWKAAKSDQKNWYIFFVISFIFLNTLGILEIIYLFWFAKKKMNLKDLKFWEALSA